MKMKTAQDGLIAKTSKQGKDVRYKFNGIRLNNVHIDKNFFNDNMYSYSDINFMYNTLYPEIIAKGYHLLEWIDVKDFSFIDEEIKNWSIIGDKWLKDSADDKDKLGESLKEIGTYWPIYLSVNNDPETNDKQKYIIRDGIHRVWSYYNMYKNGKWDKNRKVLAAITNTDPAIKKKPTELFNVAVPSELIVSHTYAQFHGHYIDRILKPNKFPFNKEDPYHFSRRGDTTVHTAASKWSLLLRNAIFDVQQDGFIIYGHPLLNDQTLRIDNINLHAKMTENYNEYFVDFLKTVCFKFDMSLLDINSKEIPKLKEISSPLDFKLVYYGYNAKDENIFKVVSKKDVEYNNKNFILASSPLDLHIRIYNKDQAIELYRIYKEVLLKYMSEHEKIEISINATKYFENHNDSDYRKIERDIYDYRKNNKDNDIILKTSLKFFEDNGSAISHIGANIVEITTIDPKRVKNFLERWMYEIIDERDGMITATSYDKKLKINIKIINRNDNNG